MVTSVYLEDLVEGYILAMIDYFPIQKSHNLKLQNLYVTDNIHLLGWVVGLYERLIQALSISILLLFYTLSLEQRQGCPVQYGVVPP